MSREGAPHPRTQRIADMREPPMVGRFYMVPTVTGYPYHGHVSDWPVIGPLHDDREHFRFNDLHYHVDARFLTARQRNVIARHSWGGETVEATINRFPLFYRTQAHRRGRPPLVRRKCTTAVFGFAFGDSPPVQAMQDAFGPAPDAIRKADGRMLCPHRKVDLSQFTVDAEGMVTCPLHGLRVRCVSTVVA